MTTTATSVRTHLAEDILPGHPDRIADAIAESIVDEAVAWDSDALVGVEVAVHRNSVFVTGRVAATRPRARSRAPSSSTSTSSSTRRSQPPATPAAGPSEPKIVADLDLGPLDGPEREIRQYSDDQNLVVGYAEGSDATNYLPAGPFAARRLREHLTALRNAHPTLLGPDGKVLIRLEEHDDSFRWRRLNVSLHHAEGAGDYETLYELVLPALEQASQSLDESLPGSPEASTTSSST